MQPSSNEFSKQESVASGRAGPALSPGGTSESVPVSIMIPSFRRTLALNSTLSKLQQLRPLPEEILVFLNAPGPSEVQQVTASGLVRVFRCPLNLGPGGARAFLLKHARHEYVLSLDDDSYPLDNDFLERVMHAVERAPGAEIIGCQIYERHQDPAPASKEDRPAACFVGCGCIYRRSTYKKVRGYVPLPLAYGMEEIDLALQYWESGYAIATSRDLRIRHDTVLQHHASLMVSAHQVANQGLFVFLRYPPSLWMYGLAQLLHKFWDTLKRGRWMGAFWAWPVFLILILKYRRYRHTVNAQTIRAFRQALRDER